MASCSTGQETYTLLLVNGTQSLENIYYDVKDCDMQIQTSGNTGANYSFGIYVAEFCYTEDLDFYVTVEEAEDPTGGLGYYNNYNNNNYQYYDYTKEAEVAKHVIEGRGLAAEEYSYSYNYDTFSYSYEMPSSYSYSYSYSFSFAWVVFPGNITNFFFNDDVPFLAVHMGEAENLLVDAGNDCPTKAPVASPSMIPVPSPTMAPSPTIGDKPTMAPAATPTLKPTLAPTKSEKTYVVNGQLGFYGSAASFTQTVKDAVKETIVDTLPSVTSTSQVEITSVVDADSSTLRRLTSSGSAIVNYELTLESTEDETDFTTDIQAEMNSVFSTTNSSTNDCSFASTLATLLGPNSGVTTNCGECETLVSAITVEQTTTGGSSGGDDDEMDAGTIAGITVGCAVGVAVLGGAGFFGYKGYMENQKRTESSAFENDLHTQLGPMGSSVSSTTSPMASDRGSGQSQKTGNPLQGEYHFSA